MVKTCHHGCSVRTGVVLAGTGAVHAEVTHGVTHVTPYQRLRVDWYDKSWKLE